MMEKGRVYLVKEKKPEKTFEYFQKIIKMDFEGLCISRRHPESLKQKYEMDGTTILWLTTAMGEDYINPTNLGILTNFTVNFMEKNPSNCVIMMDGIEYLSIYNDFMNVLKSIYFLNEVAMKNEAIVLISITPGAFIDKNLALLERDIEVMEPGSVEVD